MALNLVAYDASDNESESEEIAETIVTKSVIKNPDEDSEIPKPSEKEKELAELARREKANLSKTLSQMREKRNGKVIIGIPSLTDLEEEYEEKKTKKTIISQQKGQSILFSKLPPPKNSRYEPPGKEIPVTTPTTFFKKNNPLIPQSVMKNQPIKKDSDDEDESGNFFTIDEPALKETNEVIIPEELVHQTAHQIYQPVETVYSQTPTNQHYNLAHTTDFNEPVPMELDDEALQALQGTKRKLPDDAQIIDVQAERLTYDPNLSYLKQISEERSTSSGQEITYNKLQKKKHQITYLAAQAKAREVDLKNQWAQNKSSRRQTQAKYGF